MTAEQAAQYQVGWVCALAHELTAARVMLDEEHSNPHKRAEHDNNNYVLGRIHQHNVVIACLPGGTYGTNSAAVVATNMLRTFTNIRFSLLVGIGAGIPDLDRGVDIRLGDVVVSYPDGTHGGVVQYDLGKDLGQGMFERKGSLNRPPTVLLNAITALRSTHEIYGNQILEILSAMRDRFPRLAKSGFVQPNSDTDVLYGFDVSEKSDPGHDAESYSLLKRPPREDPSPEVHYGIIASGNTLIKNVEARERLKKDFAAKCVEMEAAGLMNDLPCVVIRGICDYADQYKNDIWQRYAAVTAAAYAKELLDIIAPEAVEKEKAILKVLESVHHILERQEEHSREQQSYNERQERRDEDRELESCHQALRTSNYEEAKNINPIAANGTCRWVLEHERYRSWRDSQENNLLWISADPGCGKSVLSKLLIDTKLRANSEPDSTSIGFHTICYFFFKDDRPTEGLSSALCALLHQIFSQQRNLRWHALLAFKEDEGSLQGETDKLWRILLDVVGDAKAQPIVCILDALDECRNNDRQKLVDLLCGYHSTLCNRPPTGGPFKWLVTSRPYYDLQMGFDQIPPGLPSIRLRGEDMNDQIEEEINAVIEQRMQRLTQELTLSPGQAQKLMQQLLDMKHRTYLWLYLAIDDIKQTFYHSLRPTEESLPLLPTSVEEAYEKILSRVKRADQKRNVRVILTIIVGAQRPLSIGEMALALDMATRSERPASLNHFEIDTSNLEDRIRQWCGLFVFVNHGRLYFLHQTAKEFLLSHANDVVSNTVGWKHFLQPSEAEVLLARICVRFLCLDEFNHTPASSDDENDLENSEISNKDNEAAIVATATADFYKLAAEAWAMHARGVEDRLDEETQLGMRQLYDDLGYSFHRWTPIMWKKAINEYARFSLNQIQLAAFNGHHRLLKDWLFRDEHLTSPEILDAVDGTGRTALAWAAELGYLEMVQVLVEQGARISYMGYGISAYGNALQAAAVGGHAQIVQYLYEHGADIKARRGNAGPPLHAAAHRGHEQVVKLLIQLGANVNAKGGNYGYALQAAAAAGHEHIIKLLLSKGADINAQGGNYGSALQAAVHMRYERAFELLMHHGADVNVEGGPRGTALQAAVAVGREDFVRLLLDNGADVNFEGGSYGYALHAAAVEGYGDMVRLLLDRGADAYVKGSRFSNALHAGLSGHKEEVVRLLLDRCYPGVNVNSIMDKEDESILWMATGHDGEQVFQLLLDRGATFVMPEQDHVWTECVLCTAIGFSYTPIIRILGERCLDFRTVPRQHFMDAIASREKYGLEDDEKDTLQLLLKFGADIDLDEVLPQKVRKKR